MTENFKIFEIKQGNSRGVCMQAVALTKARLPLQPGHCLAAENF
jgi:hypothetical protein